MSNATAMPCPVCSVALVLSDRQGIELDYCPQCRGVWLDRGELDKIIERSAPPPQLPGRQRMREDHREDRSHGSKYDDRYPKKRRKSFLQELFD